MKEVNPSRGTVECGEWLPLLGGAHEARAEQGPGVTEEVCRDNGVLWMQLPDEGDRVKHLLWVAEEAADGGVVPHWKSSSGMRWRTVLCQACHSSRPQHGARMCPVWVM